MAFFCASSVSRPRRLETALSTFLKSERFRRGKLWPFFRIFGEQAPKAGSGFAHFSSGNYGLVFRIFGEQAPKARKIPKAGNSFAMLCALFFW